MQGAFIFFSLGVVKEDLGDGWEKKEAVIQQDVYEPYLGLRDGIVLYTEGGYSIGTFVVKTDSVNGKADLLYQKFDLDGTKIDEINIDTIIKASSLSTIVATPFTLLTCKKDSENLGIYYSKNINGTKSFWLRDFSSESLNLGTAQEVKSTVPDKEGAGTGLLPFSGESYILVVYDTIANVGGKYVTKKIGGVYKPNGDSIATYDLSAIPATSSYFVKFASDIDGSGKHLIILPDVAQILNPNIIGLDKDANMILPPTKWPAEEKIVFGDVTNISADKCWVLYLNSDTKDVMVRSITWSDNLELGSPIVLDKFNAPYFYGDISYNSNLGLLGITWENYDEAGNDVLYFAVININNEVVKKVSLLVTKYLAPYTTEIVGGDDSFALTYRVLKTGALYGLGDDVLSIIGLVPPEIAIKPKQNAYYVGEPVVVQVSVSSPCEIKSMKVGNKSITIQPGTKTYSQDITLDPYTVSGIKQIDLNVTTKFNTYNTSCIVTINPVKPPVMKEFATTKNSFMDNEKVKVKITAVSGSYKLKIITIKEQPSGKSKDINVSNMAAYSGTVDLWTLPQGIHTLDAKAKDMKGNISNELKFKIRIYPAAIKKQP